MLILTLFLFSCTKNDKATDNPIAPTIDQEISVTEVMKYFFAGDSVSTDAIYSPQGINFGDLIKKTEYIKTVSIKNSPLFEDFPLDIKIDEKEPKIFSIIENNCQTLKTGSNCLIKIKALYNDNLFTSTKTARLIIGKKDGVDLYLELFGQIRNISLSSSQYESNYSISMNKGFSTDYTQFEYQERIISITNNSLTKYLRNDYIIPELVGQGLSNFYIASNNCVYPLSPNDICNIRVLYKKWKTTSEVSDTEIKFPGKDQHYSLKYNQFVTYNPILSDWGVCSKTAICSGIGTQTRTITDCIKNGLTSVDSINCSAQLIQNCNSPAGNRDLTVIGGVLSQSCLAGSTQWIDNSILCNTDFHSIGFSCIADTFTGTYSSYSPSTNPFTQACQGTINATRSVLTCTRDYNNESVPITKCIDPNPILIFNSPPGTRSIAVTNGVADQVCAEGSTQWVTTNINCNSNYYLNNGSCQPIVYVPTFSSYTTSPVETTVCSGTDTVTRSIISCKMQHNNQIVSNSFCTDPSPSIIVESPQGNRSVTLTDPLTLLSMGSQIQSCSKGSTVWIPINTSCFQYYSVNGETCLANNLASPTSNISGTVYSTNSSYIFNVLTDLNATNLNLYSDISCSQQIGSGIPLGFSWQASSNFIQNVLTSVYAKSTNSYTLKESQCNYLFSYMFDNQPPAANFLINNGSSKTTLKNIQLNFSSIVENSGIVQTIEIYEQPSCQGSASIVPFQNPISYTPLTKGDNLTISVKLIDPAGNKSGCLEDSILFGMEIVPKYVNAPNWMNYVDPLTGNICSGSGNCIHGGEKKIINLDQTSCQGLSMVDDFNFFEWACEADPINLGKVRFYSVRINDNKGLNSFIDDRGILPLWKINQVSLIENGIETIQRSTTSAWFGNTLEYIPAQCYDSGNNPQPSYIKQPDCVLAGFSWYIGSPVSVYSLPLTSGKISIVRKTDRTVLGNEIIKSRGINFTADSTGLVIMDEVEVMPVITTSLIFSSNQKYNYIEANLSHQNTPNSDYAIYLLNSKYSLINNGVVKYFNTGIVLQNSSFVTVKEQNISGGAGNLIELSGSTNNIFYKNLLTSSIGNGFYIGSGSSNNLITRLTSANNANGIFINNASQNSIIKSSSSNNIGSGLRMVDSNSNIISESSFGSNQSGILLSNSNHNKFITINILNNEDFGISFPSYSNYNLINNALILNNGHNGIILGDNPGNSSMHGQNLISQVAAFITTDSSLSEGVINISSFSINNKITGNLYFGLNSVNCQRTSDQSGMNSSCLSAGLSDFNFNNIFSSPNNSSFISQSSLSFPYSSDSFYSIPNLSIFQKNDTSFSGQASSRNRCSSGNCLVYDYTLSQTDSILRSRSNNPLSINSSSIVLEGLNCPVETDGDNVLTNGACVISNSWNYSFKTLSSCVSNGGVWASIENTLPDTSTYSVKTFLKNAVEIIDPFSPKYSAGNHDGLCESGEACMYVPNFGAYQGSGNLSTCLYNPQGGLSNIIMSGFSQNGL